MPDRPSRVWKDLPPDKRLAVADAFWRDEQSQDIHAQRVEAIVAIAHRLNFRAKSVQALPVDKRARYLAQMSDVSDAIASRALIAYHFSAQRALMAAFLDAVGIAHENGMITAEHVDAPDRARVAAAIDTLRRTTPAADLEIYLRTLVAVDGETWKEVDGLLPLT
ncbi:MAG: hypothetical protein ACHQO8_11025 [Vicinamibacterales bacterium]